MFDEKCILVDNLHDLPCFMDAARLMFVHNMVRQKAVKRDIGRLTAGEMRSIVQYLV